MADIQKMQVEIEANNSKFVQAMKESADVTQQLTKEIEAQAQAVKQASAETEKSAAENNRTIQQQVKAKKESSRETERQLKAEERLSSQIQLRAASQRSEAEYVAAQASAKKLNADATDRLVRLVEEEAQKTKAVLDLRQRDRAAAQETERLVEVERRYTEQINLKFAAMQTGEAQIAAQARAKGLDAAATERLVSLYRQQEAAQKALDAASSKKEQARIEAERLANAEQKLAEQQRLRYAAMQGDEALLIAQAKAKGLSAEATQRLVDEQRKLAAQQQSYESALASGTSRLDKYGNTAKQTAAAMRQVPAQITDIAVSLQGGQAPLTVLLQQGGQLRDIFGGVSPAVRALGGAIVNMINPLTLAAVAVGGLALAYKQGSEEADAFRKSLLMSGNITGTSVDQLAAIAGGMREVGVTTGKAAEILAQFVATGRVASADLEQFTATAAAMEKLFDLPVGETIKTFAELGKSPVEASRKLNEEIHFLTAATYEQIKALYDEGRALEAGQLAQRSYSAAMRERTDSVKESLGSLERAWATVGTASKMAWDAMLDVGRSDSLEQQIANAEKRLQDMARLGVRSNLDVQARAGLQEQVETLRETIRLRDRSAMQQRDQRSAEEAAIKAADAVGKVQEKSLTRQDQLNKALREYRENLDKIRAVNPASSLLGADKIKAGEDALREQFKTKETERAKSNAAEQYLDQLRRQLDTVEKISEVEKLTREIQRGNIKDLTASQREQLFNAARLVDEEKARVESQKEQVKLLQQEIAFINVRRSYQSDIDRQRQQLQARAAGFGQGARARSFQAGIDQINQRYASDESQALSMYLSNLSDPAKAQEAGKIYNEQIALIREYNDQAVTAYKDAYDSIAESEKDWRRGAKEGMLNYANDLEKLGLDMEQMFNKTFKGMEDAMVNFVMTGKLSFSDLANSIIADLVRIAIRQAIMPGIVSGFGSIMSVFGVSLGDTAAAGATPSPRASGGPVFSNSPYLVGEQGPELFIPSSSGSIVPNGALSNGGIQINVNNNAGSDTRASATANQDAGGNTIIDIMVERVEAGINRRISQGGGMAPMLERRYGLNPAAGALR